METNLHPITKEYSIVLVPIEAENIEKDKIEEIHVLTYDIPEEFSGLNCRWVRLEYTAIPFDFQLIGPLSSITEEKAREIVESSISMLRKVWYRDYRQDNVHFRCLTALESLHSLISSLGIKKEGFKEIIIKH